LSEQWIDLRLVSGMRFMLAASALLVVFVDPSEPHYSSLTFIALGCYTFYSAVFFILSVRRSELIPSRFMHWFDMLWYLGLVALSGGTSSIFFNFFFFAILVASFGWGYISGLQLTLVTAVLFTLVAVYTSIRTDELQVDRLLLRPIQLLILGFMISRWGGFKVSLRNRLQLLKDVSLFASPQFGIDRTINAVLERLRAFYDADACLILMSSKVAEGESYQLYRVRRGAHPSGTSPPQISAEAAQLFLVPSPNHAVVYNRSARVPTQLFDLREREFSPSDSPSSERVASALEANNYLSVPVNDSHQSLGRLYVVGGPRHFDKSAMGFLLQLMDHVSPLIENTRLVDSLASYAAEEERRRIARDIHDSVIQPYVGLQIGITALSQKLKAGNTDVLRNAEELLALTNQELVELRRYVWGLRAGEERRDVLLPAIERFVARFATVTGIDVDVTSRGKIEVNDRLAAELFQMVTEGLSNVRRHAFCNEAKIDLRIDRGKLLLRIKNRRAESTGELPQNGDDRPKESLFHPRSISERAAMLGGETVVSIDDKNYTVVTVSIPL
jgi:signal transduction histidine kinase